MQNVTAKAEANPLSRYFRQPAIHIKLPSEGQFWPEGSIELPVTGEIPVYPMTTRDEITLRTPDALMNGSGVIDVIQSCCPSIKNGWHTPSIDVDAILISIRIASYGPTMDIDTKCPYCGEDNKHGINLQDCLASIKCPDYNKTIDVENLKIKLRPVPFFGNNKQGNIEFEEQKMLQALEKASITEAERNKQLYESIQRLIVITIETLSASTEYIELDNGVKVSDPGHILEFYSNVSTQLVKQVQAKLADFNVAAGIKPQSVACGSCTKAYEVPIVFDYAAFFAKGF